MSWWTVVGVGLVVFAFGPLMIVFGLQIFLALVEGWASVYKLLTGRISLDEFNEDD